jgi:TPR repeat protein
MIEPGPMSRDVATLYRRADDGDPSAQRELAICLNNGDGVPQNQSAASLWLRKAMPGHKLNRQSNSEPSGNKKTSAKASNG